MYTPDKRSTSSHIHNISDPSDICGVVKNDPYTFNVFPPSFDTLCGLVDNILNWYALMVAKATLESDTKKKARQIVARIGCMLNDNKTTWEIYKRRIHEIF